MSRWRLAIVLGVTGCLTFQVGSAHAQASSCVKIMLEYVGKPLAKAFAEKGASMAAEYVVSKLNQRQHAGRSDSSANQLTQRDLEELRAIYAQNGETECQRRQDLQQVANNRDYMVLSCPVLPSA